MDPLAIITLVSVFALVIERITAGLKRLGLVGNFVAFGQTVPVPVVVSMALGLLFALGTPLDLFAAYGIRFQYLVVGEILTGILLGGGSNLVNDVGDAIRASPKALTAGPTSMTAAVSTPTTTTVVTAEAAPPLGPAALSPKVSA